MTNELTILALYGLVVCVTLIVQATGAMSQLGMGYLLSARDEQHSLAGMSARLDRALSNSITAMALFAPAILLLQFKDGFTANTLLAAQGFLVVRILYVPLYAFGVTGLRTAAWMIGFLATVALYAMAL